MLPVFRAVVFVIHLKPGDIVPGILVLRPLLSIRPFVYRLSLLLYGEALDFKAPLLRALEAVNRAAVDILPVFRPEGGKSVLLSGMGSRRYFLGRRSLWAARPDLVLTGRTMMGHESAKNQQLDDHYFGFYTDSGDCFYEGSGIRMSAIGNPVKPATMRWLRTSSNLLRFSKRPIWLMTTISC